MRKDKIVQYIYVALHDAKKTAKCKAHLMFPSKGVHLPPWLGAGHGTRMYSSIEAEPRVSLEQPAKSEHSHLTQLLMKWGRQANFNSEETPENDVIDNGFPIHAL